MKKLMVISLVTIMAVCMLHAGSNSMAVFPQPGTYDLGSAPPPPIGSIYPTVFTQNVELWPFTRDGKFQVQSVNITQEDSVFSLVIQEQTNGPSVTLPVTVSNHCGGGVGCVPQLYVSPSCTITTTTAPGNYKMVFTIVTSNGNLNYTDTCEVT